MKTKEPKMPKEKRGRVKRVYTAPCTVPGCHGGVVAKGLCAKHDRRMRRHGDLYADKARKGGRALDAPKA